MDEIESLFDDVTPQDLLPPTTAVRRNHDERDLYDDEAFAHFLLIYLEAARLAAEVNGGESPGLIVLANAGELRVFIGRFDETTGAFIGRVTAEAAAMPAAWLFASISGVAVIGQTLDLQTASGKKQFRGNNIPVVNWYAEATTLDMVRFGVLNPGDDMRCYVGTDPAGADPDFRRILVGAA